MSYNFSINEFLASSPLSERNQLFADNQLSSNFIELAFFIIRLRNYINLPIRVNSFYRSPVHNSQTSGSSLTSQHLYAAAVDITCSDMQKLVQGILLLNPKYRLIGQVIHYKYRNFVHVALTCPKYPHLSLSINYSKS